MNKTDKNTNNNLIFKQIFCEHLSQIITKINYDKGKTYHHLALKGFVETTFKIYYKCLLARRHIDQNGKKVFVSENGKAKEVMVETATRTDASILVISGLKVGDKVLTSGVMSLKDEAPIVVKIK